MAKLVIGLLTFAVFAATLTYLAQTGKIDGRTAVGLLLALAMRSPIGTALQGFQELSGAPQAAAEDAPVQLGKQ